MRSSSNPAFRNLPAGQGGHATLDRGSGMAAGTAAYADRAQVGFGRADAGQRPITVDDIVTKTAITAGAAIVAGGLTAWSGLYGLALPAFIVGFVVSLIIIFKQSSNPALVMIYSIAEGIALGGIAGMINQLLPGHRLPGADRHGRRVRRDAGGLQDRRGEGHARASRSG